MQSLQQALGRVPNVAIVGAGVSGLRTADVLIRSGVQVTVYEARNRVGGRLHQQESGGHLVDMGPNWIHGSKGNPVVKLAQKTKTSVMEPEEGTAVFNSRGQRLRSDLAGELSGSMWSTILAAFTYSDENSATIDPQTSLYDYFVETLSKKITDPTKLELALDEVKAWGPFVGDPVEKQSLKFFFLEECIDGENVFVASTYRAILHEVARTAVLKRVIQFNTEIKHFDRLGDSVRLTTGTGEQHIHDEVVITCPLGWLKRHHSTSFTPPLPRRLATAVQNIGYGRLEKLYLTFSTAWWLSPPPSSSSESPSDLRYPSFTHFHPPAYHHSASARQASMKSSWSQNIVSLAHLPPPHAHPTLLFYIHGDCASEVVRSISHVETHTAEYNKTLMDFAEPFYSLLPNYDREREECTPKAVLCTSCQSDPLAGNGSYCNFQVGLEHADEDIEVMRDSCGLWRGGGSLSSTSQGEVKGGQTTGLMDGINNETHDDGDLGSGGLWLAGEHVAPFVALGTTTGAYWSGEGVARRICGKWGVEVAEDEGGV